MNSKHQQQRLAQLGEYPFARLKKLLDGLKPNPNIEFIDAGAGEPRLPLPSFVQGTMDTYLSGFSKYPTTSGNDFLRQNIASWLKRRFTLNHIDADTQVLSANGTREALFAAAHALVNPEAKKQPWVIMPNPMYQIYLGAAITAGGKPYLQPCTSETNFAPDLKRSGPKPRTSSATFIPTVLAASTTLAFRSINISTALDCGVKLLDLSPYEKI